MFRYYEDLDKFAAKCSSTCEDARKLAVKLGGPKFQMSAAEKSLVRHALVPKVSAMLAEMLAIFEAGLDVQALADHFVSIADDLKD